jgi:hypothetical protein
MTKFIGDVLNSRDSVLALVPVVDTVRVQTVPDQSRDIQHIQVTLVEAKPLN